MKVLRGCEEEEIQKGALKESQILSDKMEQSMENGLFWFCIASRKSFMFDEIYWTFLHNKYFGHQNSIEEQVLLLSSEEQKELPEFVQSKMQQAAEKTLAEHLTFDEVYEL